MQALLKSDILYERLPREDQNGIPFLVEAINGHLMGYRRGGALAPVRCRQLQEEMDGLLTEAMLEYLIQFYRESGWLVDSHVWRHASEAVLDFG